MEINTYFQSAILKICKEEFNEEQRQVVLYVDLGFSSAGPNPSKY